LGMGMVYAIMADLRLLFGKRLQYASNYE